MNDQKSIPSFVMQKNFLKKNRFFLPKWADWTWEEWQRADKNEIHEILEKELGWDVTEILG
jgi:D-lyxose ketol-isomerase